MAMKDRVSHREGEGTEAPPKGPLRIGTWSLLALRLWGPDIFISYRRTDKQASKYARELYCLLEAKRLGGFVKGLRCFFDEVLQPTGQQIEDYKQAARRSRMFVLVGTSSIFASKHIPHELQSYWQGHDGRLAQRWRRILPINVGGALDGLEDPASGGQWKDTPWEPLVGKVSVRESTTALATGVPSPSVVDGISQSYTLMRSAVLLLLSFLLAAGVIFSATAYSLHKLAVSRQQLAEVNTEVERVEGERDKAQQEIGTARQELGEAQRAIGSSREELSRLGLELSAAQQDRDTAREQAQAAQEQRDVAQTRTREARELQRQAEAQTREAVAESLLASGKTSLPENPAAAVNLAFLAAERTSSLEPGTLLRDAIKRIPVWYRYLPDGLTPDQVTWGTQASDRDPIAADRTLSVILSQEGSELVLRRVPTGELLARRALKSGEGILTPEPLASRLVALAGSNEALDEVKVFDLEAHDLATPVLALAELRAFTFTDGDWPCYALTRQGEVVRYDEPSRGEEPPQRRLGQWTEAFGLSAHPRGGAVAVVQSRAITWLPLDPSGSPGEATTIPWPKTILKNDWGRRSHHALRWGPTPPTLLVATNLATLTIHAVHGPSGRIQEVHRTDGRWTERFLFEVAREGRRLIAGSQLTLLTQEGEEEVSGIRVLDLEWNDGAADAVAKVASSVGTELARSKRSGVQAFIDAVISPNGNYAVVSKTFDTGVKDIGLLESWALSELASASSDDLGLAAMELKNLTAAPVLRLAYSADSSRLLTWTGNGIASVFRVKSEPPSYLFERTPEELERRLSSKPQIDSTGRFFRVAYGASDVRYHDLATGRELRLETFTGGASVLGSDLNQDGSLLRIVTRQEILEVRDGSVSRRATLERKADRAHVSPEVILVASGRELWLFNPRTLRRLGSLALEGSGPPARLSAARLPSHPLWIYAETSENRLLAWSLAKEGAGQLRQVSHTSIDMPKGTVGEEHRLSLGAGTALVFVTQNLSLSVRYLDLAQGHELAIEPPPGQGWPENAAGVAQVRHFPDGGLMLILQYSPGGQYFAATWSRQGGRCRSVVPLKGVGELFWMSSPGTPDQIRLLFRDHTYEGTEIKTKIALVRADDGKELWSSKDSVHWFLPPPLTREPAGTWKALDTTVYRKVAQRLKMGGLDSARQLTSVDLPEAERRRLLLEGEVPPK